MRIRSNARTRMRSSASGSAAAGRTGPTRLSFACLVAAVLAVWMPHAAGQDAGARVYVRRIEFDGVERTADHVLRRELLQLEGAFLNTAALDESLRRIRALSFIDSVG